MTDTDARASTLEFYQEGDIPEEWKPFLISKSVHDLEATWELLVKRSDSVDEILARLKINALKRKLFKGHKTINQAKVVEDPNRGILLRLVSHLPMGSVKTAEVYTDGRSFSQFDPDTHATWTNYSLFSESRLTQKRHCHKGVIYDTRCVFSEDPEHLCDDSPLFLIRWVYIGPSGERIVSNRWHKKSTSHKYTSG